MQLHTGGAASDNWAADQYLSAGSNTSAAISTTAYVNPILDHSPAPQSVYQTARAGTFTYTIPGLTPNASYPVTLHFAEIQSAALGARRFNVLINGTPVLTNFDIFTAAGGANMAVSRTYTATASAAGTLTLQFTPGTAGTPSVNGIEILPPLLAAPLLNTGVYTITSKATGLALDDGNATTAGASIVQWGFQTGNTNQQWQINALGDGTYDLASLSDGLAIDTNGSNNSGTTVVETDSSLTPSASQKWIIVPSEVAGYYKIVNAAGTLALDSGASATAGSHVTQASNNNADSQLWRLQPVQIGAAMPFTSYEAEAGDLGGSATVISLTAPPTTEFVSPQIEASGHAYVHLSGVGDSVSFTNNTGHAVTAITLRYSIPDAPTGGGFNATLDLLVNGQIRQQLPLTSAQTWAYETAQTYGDKDHPDENPADGTPYMFWDEVHTLIVGAVVNPGDVITVQKDSGNAAAYYDIDVVDVEQAPQPLAQPANSISIVTCGAVAGDSQVDNTGAIQTCMNNAQAEGESIWIPPGTFYIKGQLQPNGITVQGAGLWYSTIYHNPLPSSSHSNIFNPTSSVLKNFAIDSNARDRGEDSFGININGSNWVIDSMRISHAGPSIWAQGTNGLIQNNRINNSYADGININNGSGIGIHNTGNYLVGYNNFVRTTGDDCLSINDASSNPPATTDYVQMQNPTFINNTTISPWWANNMGVYGGINDVVANNLFMDSGRESAIGLGIFGSIGGNLESAYVQGNVIFQGGSFGFGNPYPAIETGGPYPLGDIQNVIVRGNAIINPEFAGIVVLSLDNTFFGNNLIQSPSTDGIDISSGVNGNASFVGNTVKGLQSGMNGFKNNSNSSFSASGSNNNGFTVQ